MSDLNLVASDPTKLLNLFATLHDKNGVELQIKLNKYLAEETGASLVFLVWLLAETEEAVVQVLGNTVMEHELRFPVEGDVLNTAVRRRCSVAGDSEDLGSDLREHLRSVLPMGPQLFLNVPVPHPTQDQISILVCFVDYTSDQEMCSSIASECFRFCLGTLLNTLAYEEEKRLKLQCQSLLAVARNLFSHLGDLSDLLREIMTEARKLTNAERCSLFLIDADHHELVAKVFDGEPSTAEVRIARDQGIAGHVATTGELLNIRDAYKHPLFYKGMDQVTGFRTRNILCFPIRDENGIVGVAQLCNKKDSFHFDMFDEEVAMAFSVYCGISIMHSLVYKKIQDAQARSQLSNELMMYHMKVTKEDIGAVLNCSYNHELSKLSDFSFSPRDLPEEETPCYVFRMMNDLGMVTNFRIKKETLVRFILFVRKGYRDMPYHNWNHAVSVAHFAYLLLRNLRLVERQYITDLEALAFFVSCLCHDIDHRGTTNSFQTATRTTLASLYSSQGSVMERHHLLQTICTLNTEGCNILDGLSREDYTKCLDLIRDNILATDLANHFTFLKRQQQMATNGFSADTDRPLLLSLFMTACDLNDQTKDWCLTKRTAELVYREFFSQGDLEKSKGAQPLEMMDRERARIPHLQVQFLSDIVIPVFSVLETLFPESKCLLEAVEQNRKCWSLVVSLFDKQWPCGRSALEMLADPVLEAHVLATLGAN